MQGARDWSGCDPTAGRLSDHPRDVEEERDEAVEIEVLTSQGLIQQSPQKAAGVEATISTGKIGKVDEEGGDRG
jgi:hypothetical protein